MPEVEENNLDVSVSTITGFDMIERPPSWLLKSGISMIALVVFAILALVYFVKYPDKISGTGYLTSEKPPIEIVSRSSSHINDILVENGQEVEEGQILFHLSNTTSPEKIKKFSYWISKYEKIENPRQYLKLEFPADLKLGILQQEYAQLMLKYNELRQTIENGNVYSKIKNISDEVDKIILLNKLLTKEKKLFYEELELEKQDYERNVTLHNDSVISERELEKAKEAYLQKQRQYKSYDNTTIQNNIKIDQLKLEKLELSGNRRDLIEQYQFSINEIISRFKSKQAEWSNSYEIRALSDGVFSFSSNINSKSVVKPQQLLGYIIPPDTQDKYMTCKFPNNSAGKIEIGQKTLLKIDAYPYKEYGMVIAKVTEVSLIPEIDLSGVRTYEVKVALEENIITDSGYKIPYKPNMTVVVDIIAEEKSLLHRIFEQFLHLLKGVSTN